MEKPRLILADDHQLLVDGLRKLLEPEFDLVETVRDFPLNDTGNRDFFAREVDGRLKYDHTMQRWFAFTGHHWNVDTVQAVQETAIEAMRARQHEASMLPDKDARKAAMRFAFRGKSGRCQLRAVGGRRSRT